MTFRPPARIARFLAVPLILGILLALLAGCTRTGVTFEPEGAPLSSAAVERLARRTDISGFVGTPVDEAPEMRERVLIDLRTRGDLGDRAATLLTQGFPERTRAIPVLVRVCDVDGVRSVVVVEAAGGPTGTLRYRRLWVFDLESGAVLRAGSYR